MVNAGAVPKNKEKAGSSSFMLAAVPWLLFTVVAQHGTLKLASIGALLIAIWVARPGIQAGKPKVLELGAVITFAAFTVAAFAVDPTVAHWLERYARAIAAGLLSLIAFGSLLVVPFTEQYARERVAPQVWNSPRFNAINRRLTTIWALAFAAMVPFHIAAGAINSRPTNILFNWVTPFLIVGVAWKFSNALAQGEEA
ncbi:MAG TPA: hypothetical protein VEF89_03465 [Solirubrobacteraceae bacterium]|nr:hypothetical protein [Solirubrobacteraceae bacterium]